MNMRMDYANSDRGVALILTLIAIMVLTTIAVGIVLVTQTQVWTSYNYRLTAQARYAAEAGIQCTMNWIQNSYTAPASPPPASYITTTYPVSCTAAPCTGGSVVLSAMSGVSSNYPDSTQQTAFNSALSSQSIPGISSATSSTYATLLQMSGGVSWLPGASSGVTQTWQITSVGSVGGLRNASVQLQATYERQGTPIFTYGLAGDANSCGDSTFTIGKMDAWNSAAGTYPATHQNSGGNIGTNGNVTLSGGSTTIGGTISSSSNITVGNCPDGITNNVGGTPWTGLQQLPTALSYSNPTVPSPMTPNVNINQNGSSSCDASWPAGACTYIEDAMESNLTGAELDQFAAKEYFQGKKIHVGHATVDDAVACIDHIVKVAGIDHVGIGSDFDGISDVPLGLEDVSKVPNLTAALIRRGYSDEDIEKIMGRNFLRVIRDVVGH
jgi:Tfp pilus assembly protein PilX